MKNNTRRSFVKGAAAAGLAFAGPAMGNHEKSAGLADIDGPVADVLASYGSTRDVETEGNIIRITVDVDGIRPFAASFEQFARLSGEVRVENDNVTFDYGRTTYLVENRAA